jgi:hypothetical protein
VICLEDGFAYGLVDAPLLDVSATFYKIQWNRKAFGAPTELVAEWGEVKNINNVR